MLMFSIYDTKVQSFAVPFYAKTNAEAFRSVQSAVRAGDSLLGSHPADFVLFQVGVFDRENGVVTAMAAPISHGPLSQFVEEAAAPPLLKAMGGK